MPNSGRRQLNPCFRGLQVARPQRAYQFAKRMPFYIKFRTESLSLVGAAVKSLHWV